MTPSGAVEDQIAKYYVNGDCIFCKLCTNEAPLFFAEALSKDRTEVVRQPESEDQMELCADVAETCPVEAIQKLG